MLPPRTESESTGGWLFCFPTCKWGRGPDQVIEARTFIVVITCLELTHFIHMQPCRVGMIMLLPLQTREPGHREVE